MATYWLKIANFFHPFSFSTVVWVTPFKFMEGLYGVFTWSSKRPAIHVYFEYICWKFALHLMDRVNTLLLIVKLKSSRQWTWRFVYLSLHCFDWSTCVTDGQTDIWTELRWLRCATTVPARTR